MAITLLELLAARGFNADHGRVKLVRHKDARWDVDSLRRQGWFDLYQQYQSKPVFDGCDQIIAFVGEEGYSSRFVGVYDVGRGEPSEEHPLPSGFLYTEWGNSHFFYPLVKRPGFDDLEDRVVIDWGKGALAWHQWLTDRTVVEVRAHGRSLPPFRDYLRVHLSFDEITRLAKHSEAHRDWVAALSAVGGIYLIVNAVSGEQYVGSATGNGGIWQRWSDYARTGHGGNLRLKAACGNGAACPAAFRFSILDTFSRTLSKDEAVSLETFFKEKLGTRAFGLNAN